MSMGKTRDRSKPLVYDSVVRRKETDLVCKDPSLTKQSFADQSDINQILARFAKTGMLTHVNAVQPFYGDVSQIADYQSALGIIQTAQDLFAGMSSDIRARFSNDPAQMIAFLQDSANYDEALELGMVVKRPEVPVPATITSSNDSKVVS